MLAEREHFMENILVVLAGLALCYTLLRFILPVLHFLTTMFWLSLEALLRVARICTSATIGSILSVYDKQAPYVSAQTPQVRSVPRVRQTS